MLLIYLILISLLLNVNYAQEMSNNDQYLTKFDESNFISCDDKIVATLSAMKTESDRKLEALEKRIPENLEEIITRKMYVLENKIPDRLEEYLDRKFYKLEKKLLDKLEEYMDEKIDSVEKKLSELEKNIPDDMDAKINNLGLYINILMKKMPDSDKNTSYQLNTVPNNTDTNVNNKDGINYKYVLANNMKIHNISNDTVKNHKREVLDNKTLDTAENVTCTLNSLETVIFNLNENIRRNLEELVKKLPESSEKNINHQLNVEGKIKMSESDLTTMFNKLEIMHQKTIQTIDHKLDAIKNMTLDLQGNINYKLEMLDKKIPEKLEENINHQLNRIEKIKIHESKDNVTDIRDILESMPQKIEKTIGDKLDPMEKKMHDLQNLINKLDGLQNYLDTKNIPQINRSHDLRCKERVAKGYNYKPLYRIDNETLNHVPLSRNKAGNITYFEMHIAIKADRDGLILLSPVPEPNTSDRVFEIGVGIASNQQTDLRLNLMKNGVGYIKTPDILSPTHYVPFYIKITKGKIEFGKENSSTPILSYKDELLNSVKYFGFSSWDKNEAKYLYDCPGSDRPFIN